MIWSRAIDPELFCIFKSHPALLSIFIIILSCADCRSQHAIKEFLPEKSVNE